jgi:hypothetical protein
MAIVTRPRPPDASIDVASAESVAAHRDDGEVGVVTFVVDEDDVQLAATNALTAINHHRASLLRQGIDCPKHEGAISVSTR